MRPTADRVREALFSIIGDEVTEARVLDAFAGSGALGLEALSRGAGSAVFVERSRRVRTVLQRNIHELGFGDRCRLLSSGAVAAMGVLAVEGHVFDIVFLDPPYKSDLLARSLAVLAKGPLLAGDALVVAEFSERDELRPPAGLLLESVRSYGATSLGFIRPSREGAAAVEEEIR